MLFFVPQAASLAPPPFAAARSDFPLYASIARFLVFGKGMFSAPAFPIAAVRPITPQLSGFSGEVGGRRQWPWPHEATQRAFPVAGVAGITLLFVAACRPDSMSGA